MIKYFKIARYITAGGLATAVNLATVYALTEWLSIYYLLSSAAAFGLGLLISFVLQKFWTFEDHSRQLIHRQALSFSLTALAGLSLNATLVYSLVHYFGQHYLLAQIFSGIIIATINFFIYQRLIFRPANHEPKN